MSSNEPAQDNNKEKKDRTLVQLAIVALLLLICCIVVLIVRGCTKGFQPAPAEEADVTDTRALVSTATEAEVVAAPTSAPTSDTSGNIIPWVGMYDGIASGAEHFSYRSDQYFDEQRLLISIWEWDDNFPPCDPDEDCWDRGESMWVSEGSPACGHFEIVHLHLTITLPRDVHSLPGLEISDTRLDISTARAASEGATESMWWRIDATDDIHIDEAEIIIEKIGNRIVGSAVLEWRVAAPGPGTMTRVVLDAFEVDEVASYIRCPQE